MISMIYSSLMNFLVFYDFHDFLALNNFHVYSIYACFHDHPMLVLHDNSPSAY